MSMTTLLLLPRKRCCASAGTVCTIAARATIAVRLAPVFIENPLIGRRRIMSPNPLYFLASILQTVLRMRTYRMPAEIDNRL
jgi:hypothetical protein